MTILQKYGVRSAASFIPIKMLLAKKKGVAKKCADLFMKGTTTMKKNSANDHVKKLFVHQTAVLHLAEEKKQQHEKQSTAASSSQTNALSTGAPCQTTLLMHIQCLSQVKKTVN